MVDVYPISMNQLRALHLLRNNIRALLSAQGKNQSQLAFSLGRDKSWINKFLTGSRDLRLKDIDRIADFFHVETYALLTPGATPWTERRKGERRSGLDRRLGDVVVRHGRAVAAAAESLRTVALPLSHSETRLVQAFRALDGKRRSSVLQTIGALDEPRPATKSVARKRRGSV